MPLPVEKFRVGEALAESETHNAANAEIAIVIEKIELARIALPPGESLQNYSSNVP